jgi:hypothetical protein
MNKQREEAKRSEKENERKRETQKNQHLTESFLL